MNQNTRPIKVVIQSKAANVGAKPIKTPDAAINPTPQGIADQNCAAQAPPRKMTRAEKRKHNQLLLQKVQIQELAESKGGKTETVVLRATGEAEHLPVPATGKGSQPHNRAKQITAVEKKMGRPSEFTESEGDAICSWIVKGGSLNQYCIQHGRDHTTVYRWLRERPDFHSRYTQAHEDRADTLVDQMLEVADDAQHAQSIEEVTAARLRVETRKWIAQKMRSSKYGDKVEVKQTGAVNIRIGLAAPKQQDVIDLPEVHRITHPEQN